MSGSRYDNTHLKRQSSVMKPQLFQVIATQADMHTADRGAKQMQPALNGVEQEQDLRDWLYLCLLF